MRYSLIALLLTLALTTAFAFAGDPPAAPPATASPGVVVTIRTFGMSEMGETITTPLTRSGNVLLPLLDPVPVAGKTPEQIRDLLQEKLKAYYQTPHVSVALSHAEHPAPPVARPGDTIRLRAFDAKELDGLEAIVGSSGNVMFAVLGDISVAGRSPEEIRSLILAASKNYYRNLMVSVDIVGPPAPTPPARHASAGVSSEMWWTAADAK